MTTSSYVTMNSSLVERAAREQIKTIDRKIKAKEAELQQQAKDLVGKRVYFFFKIKNEEEAKQYLEDNDPYDTRSMMINYWNADVVRLACIRDMAKSSVDSKVVLSMSDFGLIQHTDEVRQRTRP